MDNLPEDKKNTTTIKKTKTYFVINGDHWEEIDEFGNVLRIQKNKTMDPSIPEESRWVEIQHPTNPDKTILIDRRLPHDSYRNNKFHTRGMPFSEDIAGIIIDRLINGESLSAISKDKDMPSYSIITRWRNSNPQFQEAILEAYAIRGEKYMDTALEIALQTDDPNNIVQTQKLKIDQLKTQASFDNQRYNSKQTTNAQGSNIQINIQTGVPTSQYAIDVTQRTMSETGQIIEPAKPQTQTSTTDADTTTTTTTNEND